MREVCFGIAVWFLLITGGCSRKAEITVSPSMIKLYDVESGSTERLQVAIENSGKLAIKGLDVRPSCDCRSIYSLSDKDLVSQETVTVDWDYKVPDVDGGIDDRIFIDYAYETSDGKIQTDRMVVPLVGRSVKTYQLLPGQINYTPLKPVALHSQLFQILALDGTPWSDVKCLNLDELAQKNVLLEMRISRDQSIILGNLVFRFPKGESREMMGDVKFQIEKNGKTYEISLPYKIVPFTRSVENSLLKLARDSNEVHIFIRTRNDDAVKEIKLYDQSLPYKQEEVTISEYGLKRIELIVTMDNQLKEVLGHRKIGLITISYVDGSSSTIQYSM